MSEIDALRGAYCPLVVPFADGKIDFDSYGKLIERQKGTQGLLVNATSGEPTMLSVEERGQLAEFAIRPLVVSAACVRCNGVRIF
jgi:4-hydroxy-tetrahydrodipicolinate synthase